MASHQVRELLRASRIYLKNHQGHHPTNCIGKCHREACGQTALIDAIHAIEGNYAKRQEELPL